MDSNSSSFSNLDNQLLLTSFKNKTPLSRNGATSDCFKVRIFSKWHFLKRPKTEFSSNPIYIAAFEKEFDLGFTLDHPHIVRYLSKGNDSEGIYILTEYIDGITLNEFKDNNPDFFKSEANIKRLLLQLLSALEYLHARQIVHLDLKPENILITNNGNNLKLIDLGLSYSDCYTEITGGTQSFGSPEQFSKPQLIDYRSDLYAFGKIVLYLFTGNTAINSIGQLSARFKHLVRKCIVEDIKLRNIKAIDCIQIVNKRNNLSIKLFFGVVVIFFLFLLIWTNRMKTLETPITEPKIMKHNTILVKQNSSISTLQSLKQKITSKSIVVKPTIKMVNNQSKDTIEEIIKSVVKRRLEPNSYALSRGYSDINEFNVSVLRKSFEDWKNVCNEDCKRLFEDYKSQISFVRFKAIYDHQLEFIDAPIQKKLNDFK